MLEFLVFILATWRLARLLAEEAGPYDVLGRVRELAGVGVDDVGNVYGSNELARGLICVWCNSVWIGSVVAVAHYVIPDVTFWIALPFALSAGAILVNELTDN